MTSDAKIGLLLGLVFIFIIAFIINGLPKLRGESDSNELTEIMMENNPPGIGWERRADEILSPAPQVAEENIERQLPSESPAQAASEDSSFRYAVPVPVYDPLGRNSIGQEEPQRPVGPIRTADDRPLISPSFKPENQRVIPRTTEPKTTVTVKVPKADWPKTYVVSGGDSLGSIAKKLYGPEEGNKRANVTRIFEANRLLLKSPDDIHVGQKLTIPALPITAETKGILSGPLFEQVKSIGQKLTLGEAAKPASGRFYTVKEGDNLWTISAEELGSGVRYKEIAKLNSDILPNEDDLRVGTRLRIPVN